MGVTKGKSPKGKPKSGPSRPSSASKVKKTSTSKSSKVKRPPPRQQKTKSQPVQVKKRKKYTEKELNLPKLNMITPVGVQKPRGKKKGKVFVDDKDSMMTILAMVNADKEGQLESKMMKARQLEEIREARKNELEARQQAKKSKLEEVKASVRRKRKRDDHSTNEESTDGMSKERRTSHKTRKRVAFT